MNSIPQATKFNKRRATNKRFRIKHFFEYTIGFIINIISSKLNLHPLVLKTIKLSLEMGNPTKSLWPSETIPMTSKILSGGFWNYSFYQFNRSFYFPYWAHLQYNPLNKNFIPRSHNVLSINQTHRNWLSVSFPGKSQEVSIDPAGAIMPFRDSYTIEFAIIQNNKVIRPHDNVKRIHIHSLKLSIIEVQWQPPNTTNIIYITIEAMQNGVQVTAQGNKNLLVSIRPFNMEGPAFIHKLSFDEEKKNLMGDVNILFKKTPTHTVLCDYSQGDSYRKIISKIKKIEKERKEKKIISIKEKLGISTATFFFEKASHVSFFIKDKKTFEIPLKLVENLHPQIKKNYDSKEIWNKWFPEKMNMQLPSSTTKESKLNYTTVFNQIHNHLLTLWDFNTITPGSFTYHHFWIRDAVVMIDAYLLTGGAKAIKPLIYSLPKMIKKNGLFKSQAGEWDGNGQALWIIGRYLKVTKDYSFLEKNSNKIQKLIFWIYKQISQNEGVLPPGFSAEHLGISDWYLWDNFWALGGLKEISIFQNKLKKINIQKVYNKLQNSLTGYLESYKYYPAALGRKTDAGMIGSISAVYPLKLNDYFNNKMKKTVEIIKEKYFYENNGFFQDNIHSGINPYLTMQTAETFLHLGDSQTAFQIFEKIINRSAFGYTFPEAIHPNNLGGVMGDGFHGWAFAEAIILLRNFFYLELPQKNFTKTHNSKENILLLAGLPDKWFSQKIKIENLYNNQEKISITIQNKKISIHNLDTNNTNYYLSLPTEKITIDKVKDIKYKKVKKNELNLPYFNKRNIFKLTIEKKHIFFTIK